MQREQLIAGLRRSQRADGLNWLDESGVSPSERQPVSIHDFQRERAASKSAGHPGAGVSMAPGHNAAQTILSDLCLG